MSHVFPSQFKWYQKCSETQFLSLIPSPFSPAHPPPPPIVFPSSCLHSVLECRLERGCPTRELPWAPQAPHTGAALQCGPACPPPLWNPAARDPPPPSRSSSRLSRTAPGSKSDSSDQQATLQLGDHYLKSLIQIFYLCLIYLAWHSTNHQVLTV